MRWQNHILGLVFLYVAQITGVDVCWKGQTQDEK